jgi:hypothetical protein
MNADRKEELEKLLSQWKELSDQERIAVESADWERLAAFQSAKKSLQSSIEEFESREKSCMSVEDLTWARQRLDELVQLETQNLDKLSFHMTTAHSEKSVLDQQRHLLRKVHQSYSSPQFSHWKTYS